MKKNLIIITSIVVIIAVMSSVLLFLKNDEPQVIYTDDEIKFKDEYEKLNGTELSDNYILKAINIDSDNNVKYVSDDQLLNVLTIGTNVIYFGWPDCNWCRTMLPILISTLKENNVDTLYYYNFKSLRTAYEENNDEKKVKLYEDIINIIGNDIETVFDEDSKRSGEKKMLAPTVVFIKNGNYIGLHFKTVDSQTDASSKLTKEEEEELKKKYKTLIESINNNVCVENEGC